FHSLVSSLLSRLPSLTYTLSLHDALPIFKKQWPSDHCFSSFSIAYSAAPLSSDVSDEPPPSVAVSSVSEVIIVTPVSSKSTLFRSEEHTSELQSRFDLVCRLLLEKKKLIHVGDRSVVAHEEGTGHLQVEIRLEYREFPDHYLLEADLLAVAVRDPSGRAWAVAVQF